ncbi:hypothetical protein FG427_002459 [Yersinia enterocolitica]|nr:hypothetical protein [Yersinia enterocolitica]EKN4817762.1 hypothetical protein [Yersinia enterocolitica]EKN4835057.1 hypothetical protein [Yersinia enterocolitica]
MTTIPGNAVQAPLHPHDLSHYSGTRSISDDDIYAWCSNLYYRPSEASLCRLITENNDWPASFDANGYAQSCPQRQLIFTAPQPAHN